MNRLFSVFRDARFASAVGLVFILVAIYVLGITFDVEMAWVYAGWFAAVLIWIAYLTIKWIVARRASDAMASMFSSQTEDAVKAAPKEKRQEIDMLRKRLLEAVDTIKNSKLGQTTGSAALYEMPWYIVIGNPAAGKSTAVLNSGFRTRAARRSRGSAARATATGSSPPRASCWTPPAATPSRKRTATNGSVFSSF